MKRLIKSIWLAVVMAAALTAATFGPARAQTVIDTTVAGWSAAAGPVGDDGATAFLGAHTWGQTFRAPNSTDVVLQDWTIWLFSISGGVDIRFGIAEWDGAKAGAVLFESPKTTLGISYDYQQLTFTPGVTLDPTKVYVAYFTSSADYDLVGGQASFPIANDYVTFTDFYPDGRLLYLRNFDDYGAMFTTPWGVFDSYIDHLFRATFVPAPPPVIPVVVDVMPGTDPNLVNLKARGVLPVAVLSSEEFDAATLDTGTIMLGDPALSGVAQPLRTSLQDVNGDGRMDLVLHFSMPGLVANGAIGAGSVELTLVGKTVEGQDVAGTNAIVIVP